MKHIKTARDEFLWHCKYERNLSSKTLKAYDLDMNQFINFLTQMGYPERLDQVDKIHLKEYLQVLTKNGKAKTVKRKLATLKALFNYFEFEDEIQINPFRKMRIKIREPFRLPTVMSLREIKKIFKAQYTLKRRCKPEGGFSYQAIIRDIAVVELLFATGIRVSELCNLKSTHIDLNQGIIKVNGKGDKERIIQVCNQETKNALDQYKRMFRIGANASEYFFINRLNNRLSEQSVRFMIRKYVKRAKLKKNITPHVFRHTFATMLLDAGVDIKYIQHLLGHSSIMTTQIYTHVSKKKQRQILLTKHPRKSFSADDF